MSTYRRLDYRGEAVRRLYEVILDDSPYSDAQTLRACSAITPRWTLDYVLGLQTMWSDGPLRARQSAGMGLRLWDIDLEGRLRLAMVDDRVLPSLIGTGSWLGSCPPTLDTTPCHGR